MQLQDYVLHQVQLMHDTIRTLEGRMNGLSSQAAGLSRRLTKAEQRLRVVERKVRRLVERIKWGSAGLLSLGGIWETLPEPLRALLFKS